MTTTVNLRQILDRKQFEFLSPSPYQNAAGYLMLATPPNWYYQRILYQVNGTIAYLYDPAEDAFIQLPSPAAGNNFNGSCGCFHPYGPSFTASAGSTTQVTSTLTLVNDLTGATMRCIGGTGEGQNVTITSNSYGADAMINFAAVSTAFDSTSVFQLMSGRWWVLFATGAAVNWKYYDIATNTWTAASTTSGPAANWGTDGECCATAGLLQSAATVTSTSTGSNTTTTLADTTQGWATNQYANSQVRITGGTGSGQIRVINSNTATVLTVSAAWTTTPDATSTYVIEGVDDWIFIVGNNNVALFRYAINGTAGLSSNAQATANTWITMAVGTARTFGAAGGCSLNFIANSPNPIYNGSADGVGGPLYNLDGRRIYSFRGGGTGQLDYFDISTASWTSAVAYSPSGSLGFNAGTSYHHWQGMIYIHDGIGNFYKMDIGGNTMYPLNKLIYPQGGAVTGRKLSIVGFYDTGIQEILFIYLLTSSNPAFVRLWLI